MTIRDARPSSSVPIYFYKTFELKTMQLFDFEALTLGFRSHRLLIRLDPLLPRTLRPTARCQSRYDPMEGKDLLSETQCDVSSYHSIPWLQQRNMVVRAFRTQPEDLLRGRIS